MAKILNNILCTVMVFLLTFAWTVFCLKNVKIALLLAGIVALCSCYIISVTLSKWETRKNAKQKQKKLLRDFAILLQFNGDNSALFSRMFCYYNFTTEIVDFDSIIVTKNSRCFVAFCYREGALSTSQLQSAVVAAKRKNCTRLFVFCNKVDNALAAIANSQLPTQFVDTENAFSLLEQADMLPKIPSTSAPKQRILPQIAFNRRRFGWYFCGALFTLLTSAFSYFKLYLLIWSTALFALALFSLLNKRYNRTPTNVTLAD